MRSSLVAGLLALGMVFACEAEAQPLAWHVTKTEWTTADEKGFGDFVRSIALSGCTTSVECMKGPGNPYRATDPATLTFHADCAKWVYMLRAYYAWKNGLPFSYVDKIQGQGVDWRFTSSSNQTVSRHDLVDFGAGIPAESTLKDIHDQVWTATYRMDPDAQTPVLQDFYSPKIQPGSIRPGTAIYDINGHVGIVYEIAEDGRILYMDAHPDETVSRSFYGPQFGQSTAKLGGGFKNFRPLKLIGAVKGANGILTGGKVVLAANSEIADFSTEQYRGNVAGAAGDGPNARYQYDGMPLGYFEYVRASMAGGKPAFNPAYELSFSLRSLCHEVKEREIHVNMALTQGIEKKAQPAKLPGSASGSAEWESYATIAADARLRNSFSHLHDDLASMIALWQQRDPRIVADGLSLKERLQQIYAAETKDCTVSYASSDGKNVTLTLDDVAARLFALGFDPHHCAERRWGASTAAELASCKDADVKSRWYLAEQSLRNHAEAGYATRPEMALSEMKTEAFAAPAVDINGLIDGMGAQIAFTGMKPRGS